MRSPAGALAMAAVALLLGVLVVSQFRSRDVYSRTLQQETPESLARLIADLNDRDRQLRDEIFDLRLRLEQAQSAVAGGQGSIAEAQRQLAQLQVFSARSRVTGPGIAVRIDGAFDERALSDLVNELRNAGAEAIAVNDARVGPRSWFGPGSEGSLVVDGRAVRGPWAVSAIGATEVLHVAMTRTGGIVGQFELIYQRTRFSVTRETSLDLPAIAGP
ncbi:MAG: DUF881 domain-containing protein [Chloroflexi bacterium]|nr:DUF881 domain-containing protein [Chloroflexota bacterium]